MADSKGRYIGMLVRGAGSNFNLSVGVARMRDWAKENSVEWAMDKSLKITQAQIDKLPIEGPTASGGGKDAGEHKLYPFLIRRTNLKTEDK